MLFEFKTNLSTYLGQWSKELIYAYLDVDPSQLKAALTKEKKKIAKETAVLSAGGRSYYPDGFIQDLHISYQYYLIQVRLDYNIDLAQPL